MCERVGGLFRGIGNFGGERETGLGAAGGREGPPTESLNGSPLDFLDDDHNFSHRIVGHRTDSIALAATTTKKAREE